MGYISLHYASLAIAEYISKTGLVQYFYLSKLCTLLRIRIKSWIGCAAKLYVLSLSFYVMQLVCENLISPSSRRVANIAYIFSQVLLLNLFCYFIFCYSSLY